eukprot:1381560-Rhodomonas_salina.1
MKGEWMKEWWRHFSVSVLHFGYSEGCIDTAEPLLLGFSNEASRSSVEALIDGTSSDPQIGLMRNTPMTHNPSLHMTHTEIPKRDFMELGRAPTARSSLDFTNPNGQGRG